MNSKIYYKINLNNYYKIYFINIKYIIYNILVMNFLKENEKSRIIFALNLLTEKLESGYKLESLNVKDDCIVFSKGEKQEKISIKQIMNVMNNEQSVNSEVLQTTDMIIKDTRNEPITDEKPLSDTSAMPPQVGGEYGNFSETSEMYEISEISEMPVKTNRITGGSKNIFQKSKYSETSSLKQTDMSNFSATSIDIFNGRSDKYSDTSVIKGQVGGAIFSATSSDILNNRSAKYSDTSSIKGQVGGANLTSDTLSEVSELKQRKISKTQSTSQKLDMGIFTKKSQSGGAVESLKRRMMDVGINSNSSTSSICE